MADRALTKLRRKHIGFVFQSFNLLPTLTAEENVTLPLAIARVKPPAAEVDALLERVGLTDRRDHKPSELSGGQQQRVAIARALIARPTVLFADEPTGNLDSAAGAAVLALLRDAVAIDGQTTVMVTHDPRAAAAADRVLFLADGRIVGDLAEPTEDQIIAAMREASAPMIKVALKSLAARRLRTALTALAIVLGVAMVSGAFTITDTMRGAADSLSSAAYDGTDAVVGARTAFEVDAGDWTAKRPTVDAAPARPGPRTCPGWPSPPPTSPTRPRSSSATASRPATARTSASASTPARRAPSGSRRSGSTAAAGPPDRARSCIDAATAEDQDYGVGSTVPITTRGEAHDFKVVGTARFGSVKSLGTATSAVFDLRAAQELFDRGDRGRRDPRRRPRRACPRRSCAPTSPRALPQAQVVTAAEQDRFTLEGLEQFISIIRIALLVFGGVAILVGAFTIFNTLSITVAQRTRELGLLRMVGAHRRQVLGSVLVEALAIGVLASVVGLVAGLGLAKALDALFDAMGLALPEAGTVFAARTIVVAAARRHARHARRRPAAGLAGDPRRAGRGAARGRRPAPAACGSRRARCAALASLLGRPAQALGGAAGGLARRNAMRQPGRTMTTAAALTIGVALVTLVTVVAAGLKDTTRGALEQRIGASHVITGADGWSPTEPAVERALARAGDVTGIRQDRGLAFGDKETVNAIDPATSAGCSPSTGSRATTACRRSSAPTARSSTRAGRPSTGSASATRSRSRRRTARSSTLTVRGIEHSPVIDAMGLGPVTIGRAAYDRAFENERSLLLLRTSPTRRRRSRASRTRRSRTTAAYVDEQVGDRPAAGHLLRAARAGGDRVAVRHRQHARAGDVRAHAGARARCARSA